MLKYMIKKGYIDINKMLLEIYPSLNMNEQEVIIAINLIELYKNNQLNSSVTSISKKININNDVCSNCLNSLLNKGLLSLSIEYTKSGKAKEVFNVDDLIITIEKLFNNEIKNEKINESKDKVTEIIDLCESSFNKSLTPYELELVLSWVDSEQTIINIKNAIDITLSKKISNLKYVDKILLASKEEVVQFDEEQSKILDDIFRNLK